MGGGGLVEVWGNGGISGGMGEWGVSAGLVEVCGGSLCHHREVTGRDAVSAVGVAFYLVSIRASSFKGAPSIPETYLLSSVAWGLNLRVG